jgi:hypothetical protein
MIMPTAIAYDFIELVSDEPQKSETSCPISEAKSDT